MSDEKGFYVDVCFVDGEYEWLVPMIVNGIEFNMVDGASDEMMAEPSEYFEWLKPGTWIVKYFVSNVSHEPGQMSFPETGQWDFPPHFEFDIKQVSSEKAD